MADLSLFPFHSYSYLFHWLKFSELVSCNNRTKRCHQLNRKWKIRSQNVRWTHSLREKRCFLFSFFLLIISIRSIWYIVLISLPSQKTAMKFHIHVNIYSFDCFQYIEALFPIKQFHRRRYLNINICVSPRKQFGFQFCNCGFLFYLFFQMRIDSNQLKKRKKNHITHIAMRYGLIHRYYSKGWMSIIGYNFAPSPNGGVRLNRSKLNKKQK